MLEFDNLPTGVLFWTVERDDGRADDAEEAADLAKQSCGGAVAGRQCRRILLCARHETH